MGENSGSARFGGNQKFGGIELIFWKISTVVVFLLIIKFLFSQKIQPLSMVPCYPPAQPAQCHACIKIFSNIGFHCLADNEINIWTALEFFESLLCLPSTSIELRFVKDQGCDDSAETTQLFVQLLLLLFIQYPVSDRKTKTTIVQCQSWGNPETLPLFKTNLSPSEVPKPFQFYLFQLS